MANTGSGKSSKRTAKPRNRPPSKRSSAANAERLAAEKEASDDKVFSLTHRVATLEGRERDLNELVIGHRERIAALEAERQSLTRELEGEREESTGLRERERDLQGRIEAIEGQVARLEVQRDTLKRVLTQEQENRSALEERQSELGETREQLAAFQSKIEELARQLEVEQGKAADLQERESKLNDELSERSSKVATLEAERDALNKELRARQEEIAALGERERDAHGRMVSVHEQLGRLEARGDMLNKALSDERNGRSALEDRYAKLQQQLETGRDRERDLLVKIAGIDAQVASLQSERDGLKKAIADQGQSHRAAVEEREAELRAARESERELAERLDAVAEQVSRLENERDTLKRALAEEQSKASMSEEQEAELRAAREGQQQLQQTIKSMHEQVDRLESERETLKNTLAEEERESAGEQEKLSADLDRVTAELDRVTADLDRVTAELDRATAEHERLTRERDLMASRQDDAQRERDRLRDRLEVLESSRTYRMMRMTWRARARIRHPFRRKRRPALAKGRKAARKDEPAGLPSPATARPDQTKIKPIPRPAMRPKASRPPAPRVEKAEKAPQVEEAEEAPQETPEPQPRTEPSPVTQPEPATPAVTVDLERERWLAKTQAPPADVRELRVAGILDEMSAACFGPDCDLLRIESEGWEQALEAQDPHMLLVESTWQGNNGSWQYMVASYTHPDYIGLPNLKKLIGWCRQRDIPTVFWNKEDPVHFERFKEAAALFDYVFTSDATCIERYAELERDTAGPIEALQFAAQPLIHNPLGGPVERSPSPVFAGAYYRDRHIDRQRSLQMLLDAAMPFGLEIYDRRFGHEDQAFGFPERFKDRVKGALTYEEMLDAYKAHRVFLNVNSVTDSPTMFSRRVFELLACGTAVVSTESLGVEKTLGDVVAVVETEKEATEALSLLEDDDHWRSLSQRGRRRVLAEHTYRHRLAEIAGMLGFNVTAYPGEEIAALALVDDVEQARQFRAVVAGISAQATLPAELLIGSHTSVAGDLQELPDARSEIRVRVVQQDAEATRSQRYRELAALAASPRLAILHPAHSYGEHHLTDLILTTRFAEADIIGNASYETTDGSAVLDRSLEHRFVESVHPHSVLVKRDLVARRGWPDELPSAGAALGEWFKDGVRIYSGDAGNFEADAALGLPEQASAATPSRRPEG